MNSLNFGGEIELLVVTSLPYFVLLSLDGVDAWRMQLTTNFCRFLFRLLDP